MKRYRFALGIALAIVLILPAAISAQLVSRGSVSGTVYDTTGAVVPNAKVTISSVAYGSRDTQTAADGTFLFLALEPGKYSLKVELANFKTSEIKEFNVRLNERTNLEMKLEPGAITEVVTVTERGGGIDPSTTTSGGSITSSLFQNAPVGRNITDIPYLVAGVSDGGGTGVANPSISGGSGLENLYLVNGVNITNTGYGAIGTFNTVYGPLGTGVQFDFVREVQVKTSGFEAQYGQSLGGVVNMITKSGGNRYYGSGYFYAGPDMFEAERKQPNSVRFNRSQAYVGQTTLDLGGEVGGYVMKDRLFWYGGLNYVWNRPSYAAPDNFLGRGLGVVTIPGRSINYSAKINYNLTANQTHQLEGSVFGDPTRFGLGPNRIAASTGGGSLQSDFPERAVSELEFGSRSWSVRYNGVLRTWWLMNASFAWSFNSFDESGMPDVFGMQDRTEATPGGVNSALDGLPTAATSRGLNQIGGIGFFENTEGNNKQYAVNGTNTYRFFGSHQTDYGFLIEDVDFSWFHERTGPDWALPCFTFDGTPVQFRNGVGAAAPDCGEIAFGAQARMRVGGPSGFRIQQTRGAFAGRTGGTTSRYGAVYLQDSWQLNKYITLKLGLRWEQQRVSGTVNSYTFANNWAPRAGIIVDPWGDRRTKIFFNFGRFYEKMPQDLAVRSLSEENQYIGFFFAVNNPNSPLAQFNNNMPGGATPGCAAGASVASCINNPANWLFDQAHLILPDSASFSGGFVTFAPGTKMQNQDEYVVGFEREFRGGIVMSARFIDRRLRRAVEDIGSVNAGASTVGATQIFVLGNPSAATDVFNNVLCTDPNLDPFNEHIDPNAGAPVGCGSFFDAEGNLAFNGYVGTSGALGPDGLADGFPNVVRRYRAFEFSIEKRFTKNWQLVGNWRISRLDGNYEGLFRNDNNQSDPNITSLFDFIGSSTLGDQFAVGVLNNDRLHVVNLYANYMFNNGLNLGVGWRLQTGVPLNALGAHPVYLNQGEIPVGGRGSQGRSLTTGTIDMHGDYTWKMSERYRVKFVADLFNIFNTRRVFRVDQFTDTGFLSGVNPPIQPNPDFNPPTGPTGAGNAYQRPFAARLAVRFEF